MKDFHSQDHNSDLLLLIHKGWVGPEREWGARQGSVYVYVKYRYWFINYYSNRAALHRY